MPGSRSFAAALLAAVMVVSVGGAAFADRTKSPSKGRGSDSTLTLVVVEPAGGEPQWGGVVTFDVSTTSTDRPYVRVDCFQNGQAVYWSSAGFFEDYPWPWAQEFRLSSTYWTGGPADCTAELYYTPDGRRFRTLASLAFHANG